MSTPQQPDPLKILELRANAKVLAESLRYELTGLKGKGANHAPQLKDVYDTVYLPRLTGLADGTSDLTLLATSLLREPLETAIASSQIETVIGLLQNMVEELGKLTV